MIQRCQPLLGTFVEIKIFSENSFAYQVIEEAFDEVKEIHDLMSFFDEKSQLSLLNREAHHAFIPVDPRLLEVLSLAKNLFEVSNGLFDVSLHRSNGNSTFADVELSGNSSVKFKKELQLDLGGIAKGYAVDCAAQVLENNNITDYIVNAGGDLRVGKSTQKIGIRNPRKLGEIICETKISNSALATSAGYFSCQKVGDKRIYPIFQPRLGALEYKDESISVAAKKCAIADALTKIVAIKKDQSSEILSQFDATAMLVSEQNHITFINQ
ncbi:MAG: FAD:protein FMN transferase [Proteobacteria bacterium]|nr:FAD:protein FMN transferase [Pseudomonadota bacterium]